MPHRWQPVRQVILTLMCALLLIGGLASDASGSEQLLAYGQLPPVPDCSTASVTVPTMQRASAINLLTLPWDVAGVTKQDGSLVVSPTQLALVDSSGLTYTPYPLWNARNRFTYQGDFKLEAALRGEPLSLWLGQLPLVYDEFVFHRWSLRLTVTADQVALDQWDGQNNQPVRQTEGLPQTSQSRALNLTLQADRLMLQLDHRSMSFSLLSPSPNQLWLGLEGSGSVARFVASSSHDLSVADMTKLTVAPCDKGLRTLVEARRPGFQIGVAAALTPWLSDPRYTALLVRNFNVVTVENALKPQLSEPAQGVFTLQEARLLAQLALRYHIAVQGHALVPNRSLPAWMASSSLASRQAIMVEHIKGVVSGMRDLIHSWDVVNEPMAAGYYGWPGQQPWGNTVWYRSMGERFFTLAFAAAHQADPTAILWVNEFAMDKGGSGDEARFQFLFRQLVKLKALGYDVGMGFEGHVYDTGRDAMDPAALDRRFKQLSTAGIRARVSEMDVTPFDQNGVITTESLGLQAQQFATILAVCLSATNCTGFTMWGVGGPYVSTASVQQGRLAYASHLLWDNALRQRPAYAAEHDVLLAA